MLKEVKIKQMRLSDRIFQCNDKLVKVRLEKKEILQKGNIYGPTAIAFKFSASVCDDRGKAIPHLDGRYCILPQTVTIPITEFESMDNFDHSFMSVLESLVEKAAKWHAALESAETFIRNWENTTVLKLNKSISE